MTLAKKIDYIFKNFDREIKATSCGSSYNLKFKYDEYSISIEVVGFGLYSAYYNIYEDEAKKDMEKYWATDYLDLYLQRREDENEDEFEKFYLKNRDKLDKYLLKKYFKERPGKFMENLAYHIELMEEFKETKTRI